MGTGSFQGVKWPGGGVDTPAPSNVEVKERVELYLYSPCGPTWTAVGWPSPVYEVHNSFARRTFTVPNPKVTLV